MATAAPNQHQVAKLAGVSRATVSFVLNGRARALKISEQCIARVEAAAAKLGYRQNHAARTLKLGRSFTLGFVSPINDLLYWGAIALGVERAARDRDYDLIRLADKHDQTAWARAEQYVGERRLDGIIVAGWIGITPKQLCDLPVPIVCIEPQRANTGAAVVTLDPEPGLRAALENLASLGHRRVAWIGPIKPGDPASDRPEIMRKLTAAMKLELTICDVDVYRPHESDKAVGSVAHQLQRAFPWDRPPTAALCYNDTLALGVYAAAGGRGLRVPQDLSVVGFDDLYASFAWPPLTTISYEFDQIGGTAMELAIGDRSKPARGQTVKAGIYRVPAKLIVRQSTAAPPAM